MLLLLVLHLVLVKCSITISGSTKKLHVMSYSYSLNTIFLKYILKCYCYSHWEKNNNQTLYKTATSLKCSWLVVRIFVRGINNLQSVAL